MIEALKIIHFLSVAVGVGGGFANLFLSYWARSQSIEFKTSLGALQGRLARAGFWAIVVLWLTGYALVQTNEGGFADMGLLFWLKILLVVALSILSAGMQLIALGLLPASLVAAPQRRLSVAKIGSGLAAGIIVLAVLAFI